MYTGLETDEFRETIHQILAHNTLIWEWVRGHKNAAKFAKIMKMVKKVAATALFQLHNKLEDNSTTHANYKPCTYLC